MSDVVAYLWGNFHREVTQVIRPFTELFPEGVSAPAITDGLFPLRYALTWHYRSTIRQSATFTLLSGTGA
ncbi:hypothetical protein KA605_000074 [Salmonella enterica subsp. enterica serovar 6,14:a:1,7]|nr:hypothetical protein [Salmonella enterica]EJU7764800.1 hypothetical protein [Salmonella enterica subsp. enterica serovar 6,14:a:1,7]